MNNTLVLTSKCTTNFLQKVSKAQETYDTVVALADIKNATAISLANEQKLSLKFQVGYVFGALKANFDCLPDEIASRQKMNGLPINFLIKMKVDEFVLNVDNSHTTVSLTNDYDQNYRRLSEYICGFGYNMRFIEDRFESFYPKGSHMFVHGFATGYSETFHDIAAHAHIIADVTDPKTQDIWKNYEFFLKRNVHEYRLDGKYLFMYHGGGNCTDDDTIPYGDNYHYVNEKVYALLKARKASDFVEQPFNFNF